MQQTCTKVAEELIERLQDEDVGFADFLYSKKSELTAAIVENWNYLQAALEDKDPRPHRKLYESLITHFSYRVSREVKTTLYMGYIELFVENYLLRVVAIEVRV